MKDYGVCYTGPFMDASGYGEATRNAIVALRSAGVNLKTEKVSFTGSVHYEQANTAIARELSDRNIPYQIKIIHVTPDLYTKYQEKNKYNIGHLFWETNKLPRSWVVACNSMNEIWTGTKLNAQTISNSGVTVPIHIFPQATETILPQVKPFKLAGTDEKTLVFYSVFEWNERKNPHKLLHAYWKEFKGHDDVLLLIKTHKGSYSQLGVEQIIQEARGWKNSLGWKDAPRVLLCTNILQGDGMYRLHKTGHVFVSAHRGEGWGLPQVEASLMGNPIISTAYGGIHEYLSSKQYYKVDFELTNIDKVYNKYYEPGMKWAEANQNTIQNHMRSLYDYWVNYKGSNFFKKKGTDARKLISSTFSYDIVGASMKQRLDTIAGGIK